MAGRGNALVLGGGGVTGVAWMVGLLTGLAERGVDLTEPDLVVGTSAGSVVGARLLSGVPLEELYADQLNGTAREVAARPGAGFIVKWMMAGLRPGDPAKGRAWLGRQALKTRTSITAADRREVVAGRIGNADWPETPLLIAAVEALTGKFVVFDRTSRVALADAVSASCAVPLVWPPADVGGVRYIDGGARSVANVQLAAGCDRLVVLAPIDSALRRPDRPASQAARLAVPHVVISPSDRARSKMGRNPLDPAFRASAAAAGREQAVHEAEKIAEVWKR